MSLHGKTQRLKILDFIKHSRRPGYLDVVRSQAGKEGAGRGVCAAVGVRRSHGHLSLGKKLLQLSMQAHVCVCTIYASVCVCVYMCTCPCAPSARLCVHVCVRVCERACVCSEGEVEVDVARCAEPSSVSWRLESRAVVTRTWTTVSSGHKVDFN